MEAEQESGARAERVPPAGAERDRIPDLIWLEVVKTAPRLLVVLLLLIGVLLLRQPLSALLDRPTEIGLGPVTLKAAEAKLEQVKLEGSDRAKDFTPEQIRTLTDRFGMALAGGRRAGVLWVDDTPQNNKDLVDFLDLIGITVVVARSYPEAVDRLNERSFNAIVTDWSRPKDEVEQRARLRGEQFWGSGARLAELLAGNGCGRRVLLFSTGSTDDVPMAPGIKAQTNSFYDLLLLIADAVRDQAPRCYVETDAVKPAPPRSPPPAEL